jgi:Domain of unknown function (DUF3854)
MNQTAFALSQQRPPSVSQNGKPKQRGKYLSPLGRANMVYFVPGLPAEKLREAGTLVIVTEGEFKTLALWRLANHQSSTPRFVPLGLSGVWNWRGKVGKETGPNGDRRDVMGVIPDVDLVVWQGRRVILAFDADADQNEQVEIARNLLARELRIRGAEVAVMTWDIAQGKGIDDLLSNIGPEKVLELIEGVDVDKQASDDDISVYQIAEEIAGHHRFARDAGGRLYVFIGRLASIRPDLSGTELASTSVFKAITGGDPMIAEYKFKDSFEFIPYARLVFSANHPPKSQDASPAFFRRWLVVPFERTFADGAPDTIPGDKLDAMLSDSGELSGVLNKALEALAAIRTRGLSESESINRATDEFRQATTRLPSGWTERPSLTATR